MFLVYIWLYTLILSFVWWLFVVIRIHAYKFKNFSYNITKVTNSLFVFLLILSLLWYFIIISWTNLLSNYDVYLNDPEKNDYNDYYEVDY